MAITNPDEMPDAGPPDADRSPGPTRDGALVTTASLIDSPCAKCGGTKWEIVPGRGARPCGCQSEQRQAKLLEQACIPTRFHRATFNTYKPDMRFVKQIRALNAAQTLARDYPVVEQGILLTGGIGLGKTHLAISILRALIEKGIACRFYDYRELIKNIQQSYNPKTLLTEMEILAPLFECEVIVLDELGVIRPTEWVQETIGLIVNTRYNDGKITILTTNYPDEPKTPADETLADRTGARVRSRLYEMCRTVEIDGEDYRKRTFAS